MRSRYFFRPLLPFPAWRGLLRRLLRLVLGRADKARRPTAPNEAGLTVGTGENPGITGDHLGEHLLNRKLYQRVSGERPIVRDHPQLGTGFGAESNWDCILFSHVKADTTDYKHSASPLAATLAR
jgi:hypothetical protein